MRALKLLIVDDDTDNRLILFHICKKLDNLEIAQAADGKEAVDTVEQWRPDIILMDVMMPKMDGFEASKVIKSRFPETVIMLVSAALDSKVKENFSRLGIEIYIHKPIDRELIRFKVQSVAANLRVKNGDLLVLSQKNALNPFNQDIRSFKTVLEEIDSDAMMDFGMWLLDQFSGKAFKQSLLLDNVLELFYKLMRQSEKRREKMRIVVEESFDEFYITIVCKNAIMADMELMARLHELDLEYVIDNTMFCIRLDKPLDLAMAETVLMAAPKSEHSETVATIAKISAKKPMSKERDTTEKSKEKMTIDEHEKDLLKQSFIIKTTAQDYVSQIGGDVLDEILELESIDAEWVDHLNLMEQHPSSENFNYFTDQTLQAYVRVINNLFEFTALAYALSSLSVFIRNNVEVIIEDAKKLQTLIMLLEYLQADLSSWRTHIFILRDSADIHYLDSSFFSSCMQIEMLIGGKDLVVAGEDDDDEMEFF